MESVPVAEIIQTLTSISPTSGPHCTMHRPRALLLGFIPGSGRGLAGDLNPGPASEYSSSSFHGCHSPAGVSRHEVGYFAMGQMHSGTALPVFPCTGIQ